MARNPLFFTYFPHHAMKPHPSLKLPLMATAVVAYTLGMLAWLCYVELPLP